MSKELRRVTVFIVLLFILLFAAASTINIATASTLNADNRNTRTILESYSTMRGPIVVGKNSVAESIPANDRYKFLRTYTDAKVYAALTGYYTLNQGNAGLESAMNSELTGSGDNQTWARFLDMVNGRTPQGASVTLTINEKAQAAAWKALGNHRGAVIAIEPKTGKILALVSKPSYDPNLLAVHDSAKVLAAYKKLNADPTNPLYNRAIAGDLYPPGSTFKLVLTAAALEQGLKPDHQLKNPSSLKLPNSTKSIQNAEKTACGPGANTSMANALRLSCNIPFAELGLELGQKAIGSQAEKFGFGHSVDVPMASIASSYPTGMDDAQVMLSSFGQYNVRATPLQMAMVSMGIANGGVVMAPNVVSQVRDRNLQTISSFAPKEFSTAISKTTAQTMTSMMVDNVKSGGAAENARISGVEVAGKTGTAQNGQNQLNTLWFTGFAPANDPQVAVAVVVENNDSYGDAVASPIARDVMKAVLSR